jgi:membrane protein
MEDEQKNRNIFVRISEGLKWIARFVTYDIWRITDHEVGGLKRITVFLGQSIILAVKGFKRENLPTKASALTFSTLLAIVPMLAVIVGIASGFGLRETVRQSVYSYFPGHNPELTQAFDFAENYLRLANGGVFIGIGLVLLLYTVFNLISNIETAFNEIWQAKNRGFSRKTTDYLAMMIILPVLIIVSSGLSLFVSSLSSSFLKEYVFLTPVADALFHIAPYIFTVLFFTALYVLVPNTRVKFLNALAAGFIIGCAFQVFQYVYISGQIWVSKYNAIYGSFAALPLLLLWLQLSWLMCLFGAEIAYASQNVKKFSFESDIKNISHRYRNFFTILITTLIIKRFEKGEQPYTADELSDSNRIPIRLTTDILHLLAATGIITDKTDEERVVRYMPSRDIGGISVGMLLRNIDENGSEDFKIDYRQQFPDEWEALIKARGLMFDYGNGILLKDL